MAVYKVPQDVEADDKLIGPFSFRQFIYLIVVAISIGLGYGLFRLFPPLAVIPLPVIIFFGALALPLRKDQPMEIYLAAVVSFYLKPRRRMWQPDGIQSLVEIVAPKVIEVQRSKDLSQMEAEQRLSYLADIVDTQGWAVRGVDMPGAMSPMQTTAYVAAQQTEDMLDDSAGISKSFDSMISAADTKRHQEMVSRMQTTPTAIAATIPDPYANLQTPILDDSQVAFNPYPSSIHQSVVEPLASAKAAATAMPTSAPTSTSVAPVSPDIINLANNPDFSIETIAHEANRIQERDTKPEDEEVVISLR